IVPHSEDAVVEAVSRRQHAKATWVHRSVRRPRLPVQIEHRAGIGPAGLQGVERLLLAADVVAMLADQYVESLYLKVAARLQAPSLKQAEWDEGGLRRVFRAGGERSAGDVGKALKRSVGAHDDVRDAVTVGVPHGDGAARPAGALLRVQPGQRR